MVGTWVTCGASPIVAMVASMSLVLNSAAVCASNRAPSPLGSEGMGSLPCFVRLHLLHDNVPDHGGNVRSAELGDLADAGRRGDVDLGEIVADHVDADEDQPALFQFRPEASADLPVAR